MTEQGYAQWEYRVAEALDGRLETVDEAQGALCFATGSSDAMTVVQALDVWGATGWELIGLAALPGGRVQYVLKRPRHQGGWEGARIHMKERENKRAGE